MHVLIRPVYADGSICLDILQNQWSPIYDVAAILTSIQVCFFTTLFLCRRETRHFLLLYDIYHNEW